MPLPLAPILRLSLRLGALAAAGVAARRLLLAQSHPGRTDQRAEDALNDLDEGLAFHRPMDLAESQQRNTAARLRRTIIFRGMRYELDAGLIARFRLRKVSE